MSNLGRTHHDEKDTERSSTAEHANERAARAARVDATRPRAERKPAMVTDARLGSRRADATHWRCFRLPEPGTKRGTPLFWGDDGIHTSEWPIKTCTAEAILERWGEGRYVVQYVLLDGAGIRRPVGRSRVLQMVPPPTNPATPSGKPAEAPAPAAAPTPAAPTLPMGLPVGALGDSSFSNLFSLLAYLEERTEKVRTAAAAENKAAQERYRADLEFQLERERLASKERVAQIEAQGRAVAVRGGGSFDAEALATRFGEVVSEKMQEALEGLEDNGTSAPAAAPADNTAAIVTALRETLVPLLSIVATKLAPTPPSLVAHAAPPPRGGDGGNDDGEPR